MKEPRIVSEADRPVGPAMKRREALDFMIAVSQLDIRKLETSGVPIHAGDLSHVAGVCYELFRFAQGRRSDYERLLRQATGDPVGALNTQLEGLRKLINGIADGEDFDLSLEQGSRITLFAPRSARAPFVPLPFVFHSRTLAQGLVVTAIFYLGLNPKLPTLIGRCAQPECGKIFARARATRVFCSHECANKASMEAYVERQRATRATTHQPRPSARKASAVDAVV